MGTRQIWLDVAGTRFHQEAIARLKMTDPVRLVREPDNKADPNAIAVKGPDDSLLGYIPAVFARDMAPLIDDGQEVPGLEVARKSTARHGGQTYITLAVIISVKVEEE